MVPPPRQERRELKKTTKNILFNFFLDVLDGDVDQQAGVEVAITKGSLLA